MLKMIFICVFMIPLVFNTWMLCNLMSLLALFFITFLMSK